MRPISRSKLVWINVNRAAGAGATVRFADIPELRGKLITGIEFYNDAMLAATPDQQAVITAADMLLTTLVLKEASSERVQDIPCSTLLPTNTAGIWKELVPFVVNWQSSFVRFSGVVSPPFTVPFNVFYLGDDESKQ